jgi:hypothetical protein
MSKMRLCVILMALCCMAIPASASLVGWWKLDDGTGTTAVDSSTKAQNGTLTGEPVWYAAGKHGGCLQFDGTNDRVVVLGSWTLPQYTVSLWFRQDGGTGVQKDLFSMENTAGGHGILLEVGTDARLRFLHRAPMLNTGGAASESLYATGPGTGAWHHMAAVKTATDMVTYIDGVQAATQANATTFDMAATRVTIGDIDERQMRPWNGLIDDVKIFDTALSAAEVLEAKENAVEGVASEPSPTSPGTDVVRDVVLSWKPSAAATVHDVYFGTTFSDVNAASRIAPGTCLVSQGQDANTFDPTGVLQLGRTYYWRIDEVNTPDNKIFKGSVWSFTVEPVFYTVTGITATASSSNAGAGPDQTISGSGMTGDLHGTENATMWLTAKNTPLPAWIQYDFGRVLKLESMAVWNYNAMFEDLIGIGAKSVKVEYSADGVNWTQVIGIAEFAQGPGADDYAANTTVDLGGVAARYAKITITETWGAKQTGLSEVRFLQTIDYARSPSPASGATGVLPNTTLTWRSGREAASHSVYVGTDANALTLSGTATVSSFAPANLSLGTQYYWRVDEVNTAEAISTWTGDVWNFTTPDFLVVDDMEGYNDVEPTRIFDVWVDGYSTPSTNGSVVGYGTSANSTFNETTIIHGGTQSMPFAYGQSAATVSEATRTLDTAQDWTAAGVKTLVLFFHGDATNTAGQLYVKINGTKVNYSGNAAGLVASLWKQWNIDLASASISNLKAVKTITIGVTGSGAKGILYFDDLRLYKSAPAVATPVDPGVTGLVASYAMEGDAKDSVGGTSGTLNSITFLDGMTGFGKAAQFNGTTGYIDLGTSFGNLISTLNSCTISTWVNYTGTGAVWQRVLDCGNGGTTPQVYIMLTTRNASNLPRFVYTRTSSAGEVIATASNTLSVGWHHLAGVVDASTMTIALYVDGRLAQGNVAATFLPKDLGKTTQNWLGRSQWSADPYLNGAIDDLRVFNRALSAGEVGYLAGDR